MGLGLSGAFGAKAAADALRTMQQDSFARQQAEFASQLAQQRIGQQDQANMIDLRRLTLAEQLGAHEMAKVPEAAKPVVLRNMAGADGKPVTQFVDPSNRSVLSQLEEYVPPQAPPKPETKTDYGDFLARFASSRGKTIEQLTSSDEVEARKQWGQADDRPMRGLAPVVIMTPQGPAIGDRATGETKPFVGPDGKPLGFAPTADMRNRESVRGIAKVSVDAVRDLSSQVIQFRGIAQRAVAAGRSIQSVLGNDPTYKTYQDARMALAGNLAVLQQGSRPSDADIRSIWLPLVPDAVSDTDESAAMKWKLIDVMSGFVKDSPGPKQIEYSIVNGKLVPKGGG